MPKFSVGGAEDVDNIPLRKSPRLRKKKLPIAAASESRNHPPTATDSESVLARNSGSKGRKSETRSTEARANPKINGESASDVEPKRTSRSVSVALSDPVILDCPICFQPLTSTVYQCKNGHIACESCCTTMKNKCATCCRSIGFIRCRAIENVLDSVRITCECKETFSYGEKLAHEKTCTYTSCFCPLSGCDYVGIPKCVYAHFVQMHPCFSIKFDFNHIISISLDKHPKPVYLQDRKLTTLFASIILWRPLGVLLVLSVCCTDLSKESISV